MCTGYMLSRAYTCSTLSLTRRWKAFLALVVHLVSRPLCNTDPLAMASYQACLSAPFLFLRSRTRPIRFNRHPFPSSLPIRLVQPILPTTFLSIFNSNPRLFHSAKCDETLKLSKEKNHKCRRLFDQIFFSLEIEKRRFLDSNGKRRVVGVETLLGVFVRHSRSFLLEATTTNTSSRDERGQAVASSCLPILARCACVGYSARGTDEAGRRDHRSRNEERERERGMNGRVEDPDGEIRTPLNPILPPNLRWESSRAVRGKITSIRSFG